MIGQGQLCKFEISRLLRTSVLNIAFSVTATAIAIGAAGIPSAGAVTTIVVLQAVSLPLDDIGLIMAVDWFM